LTHILVISNDDRLKTGITRLMGGPDCNVVLRPFANEGEIIGCIRQTVPDAVIIDTSLIASGMVHVDWLLQKVKGLKKLRILSMSAYSNDIQVYDIRAERLEQSADLFNMI